MSSNPLSDLRRQESLDFGGTSWTDGPERRSCAPILREPPKTNSAWARVKRRKNLECDDTDLVTISPVRATMNESRERLAKAREARGAFLCPGVGSPAASGAGSPSVRFSANGKPSTALGVASPGRGSSSPRAPGEHMHRVFAKTKSSGCLAMPGSPLTPGSPRRSNSSSKLNPAASPGSPAKGPDTIRRTNTSRLLSKLRGGDQPSPSGANAVCGQGALVPATVSGCSSFNGDGDGQQIDGVPRYLEYSSLFVFSPTNRLRLRLDALTHHVAFEPCVLVTAAGLERRATRPALRLPLSDVDAPRRTGLHHRQPAP